MKSLSYAYVGRKDKKSDFRKLWITRINAAARMNGTTYSKMVAGLKKANVTINRKMLAEIAVSDPKAFTEIAEIAKKAQFRIKKFEFIVQVYRGKFFELPNIKTQMETHLCFYCFFILGLEIREAKYPKNTAAAIPPLAAFIPPVKAPTKPVSFTPSIAPFAKL